MRILFAEDDLTKRIILSGVLKNRAGGEETFSR